MDISYRIMSYQPDMATLIVAYWIPAYPREVITLRVPLSLIEGQYPEGTDLENQIMAAAPADRLQTIITLMDPVTIAYLESQIGVTRTLTYTP